MSPIDLLADLLRRRPRPEWEPMPTAVPAAEPVWPDPDRLEHLVPVGADGDGRIAMALRCTDCADVPKVPHAGRVMRNADGSRVQMMHNGVLVVADGYCGAWMTRLIALCGGHHEPQEERMFYAVSAALSDDATMIELGGYWAYYSLWFLRDGGRRRAWVVEPDPDYMAVGRANAALNKLSPRFIEGFAGEHSADAQPFTTSASGIVTLPCLTVPQLMADHGIDRLSLLHCDTQGAELPILRSCIDLLRTGRIEWLIVSTHAHQISGDPLTHQRCLALLVRAGVTIVAEHDVHESFSGDGLIVARSSPPPDVWSTPRLSYNRYSRSMFRNPLYDLAAAGIAKG